MKKSTNSQEKSQQSLSAIKKGPVKGLKNVLAAPQEFVWPILRAEKKVKELETMLRELLPQKTKDSPKISWAQLRGLSKEERKLLRKKHAPTQINPEDNKILHSIIFGINAVAKALEKDTVCSVLLDSSVDPLFMIKHIVIMAQNKDIPVVIIPTLKTATLEKRGFASAALAIKKVAVDSEDSSLSLKLSKKISQLTEEFPKASGNLQIFDDENSETMSLMEEDNADIVNIDVTQVKPFILEPSVYKYRTSRKERVFVPLNSTQSSDDKSPTKEEKETSEDYIPFNSGNTIDEDNANATVMTRKRYIDEPQTEEEREQQVTQSIDSTEEFTNNNMNSMRDIKNKKSKSENINSKKSKKRKIPHDTYMPLKVKQIRKNPNRVKGKKKKIL